jgi:hypothetical protein
LFGDEPAEVLSDGRVFTGGGAYSGGFGPGSAGVAQTYFFNSSLPAGKQWSAAPVNKITRSNNNINNGQAYYDSSDEESWVKLSDGSILTYDIWASTALGTFYAERYIPAGSAASQTLGISNVWVDASTLSNTNPPSVLSSAAQGLELGPAFLQRDGNVIYFGANGNTAIYHPATNIWTAGPTEPQKNLTINAPSANQPNYTVMAGGPATFLAATDDPGAVLPNGNILIALSPLGPLTAAGGYSFPTATYMYEYNPTAPAATAFTEITPGGLNNVNAFALNMVVLPTGQVLLASEGNAFQVYTEDPNTGPQGGWRPTISSITPNIDGSFRLTGTQLNGISEGASYGDDNQSASNYPIVQLTDSQNNVSYARTSSWSSTGVVTGNAQVSTTFQLPPADGPGVYYLSTIANGIASTPVLVVFGSNFDDTVTVGTTDIFGLFPFPSVSFNGTPTFYTANAIAGIHILAAGGNNAINIQQTFAGVPVSVEGSATDTVDIGSSAPSLGGTLANIAAPVNVSNTSGSTTLNVDDSGDTTGQTVTVSNNSISGTWSPAAINYSDAALSTIKTVNLSGGSGGNTFNVQSTLAGATTTINPDITTLRSANTVNIGSTAPS